MLMNLNSNSIRLPQNNNKGRSFFEAPAFFIVDNELVSLSLPLSICVTFYFVSKMHFSM